MASQPPSQDGQQRPTQLFEPRIKDPVRLQIYEQALLNANIDKNVLTAEQLYQTQWTLSFAAHKMFRVKTDLIEQIRQNESRLQEGTFKFTKELHERNKGPERKDFAQLVKEHADGPARAFVKEITYFIQAHQNDDYNKHLKPQYEQMQYVEGLYDAALQTEINILDQYSTTTPTFQQLHPQSAANLIYQDRSTDEQYRRETYMMTYVKVAHGYQFVESLTCLPTNQSWASAKAKEALKNFTPQGTDTGEIITKDYELVKDRAKDITKILRNSGQYSSTFINYLITDPEKPKINRKGENLHHGDRLCDQYKGPIRTAAKILSQKGPDDLTKLDIDRAIRFYIYYRYYRTNHQMLSYRYNKNNLNNYPFLAQQQTEEAAKKREAELKDREKKVNKREEELNERESKAAKREAENKKILQKQREKTNKMNQISQLIQQKRKERDELIKEAQQIQNSLKGKLSDALDKLKTSYGTIPASGSVSTAFKLEISNVISLLQQSINGSDTNFYDEELLKQGGESFTALTKIQQKINSLQAEIDDQTTKLEQIYTSNDDAE